MARRTKPDAPERAKARRIARRLAENPQAIKRLMRADPARRRVILKELKISPVKQSTLQKEVQLMLKAPFPGELEKPVDWVTAVATLAAPAAAAAAAA